MLYAVCTKAHKKAMQQQQWPLSFHFLLVLTAWVVAVFVGAAVLNPATAGVVPTGRNGLDIVFVTLIAPVTPINMKYLSHNHNQAQWTADAAAERLRIGGAGDEMFVRAASREPIKGEHSPEVDKEKAFNAVAIVNLS